jgi:hypothetical protein
MPGAQTTVDPNLPGARFIGKWNWGAAFLTPYWLMTHRNAPLGIVILICGFIPVIQYLAIGVLIYYGINGNKVAVLCGRYTNEAEFIAVQNAWRNWAFGVTIVTVILLGFIFVLDMIAIMLNQSRGY